MNERIKQLAEQAGYAPLEPRTFADDLQDIFLQKFAELIVKETINEMIGQLWNYGIDESNNPSFYKAVERTKQHFGVK